MAQADYSIANQGFPATRAEINSTLEAIATNNSGTSAPSTQYAGQFWIDTTTSTWTLYIHDGTDDIQFATIDTSANTVNFIDSELGDNSVTTAKIADANVTSAKLSYPLTTFSSTGIDDNATSTAITIDSGEKVGIGTSSPSRNLQVAGTNAVVAIKTTDDTYSSVFFGDTSADNIGKLIYDHTDDSLQTIVNNAERMRITSSGNVGINITNPSTKLHVKDSDIRNEGTGIYYNLAAGAVLTTGTPTVDIDISTIAVVSTRDQSKTYEMSVTEANGTGSNLSRLFYVRFQEGTGYDITSAIYSLGSVTGAVTFSRPSSGIWRVASTASLNVATLRFRRVS